MIMEFVSQKKKKKKNPWKGFFVWYMSIIWGPPDLSDIGNDLLEVLVVGMCKVLEFNML